MTAKKGRIWILYLDCIFNQRTTTAQSKTDTSFLTESSDDDAEEIGSLSFIVLVSFITLFLWVTCLLFRAASSPTPSSISPTLATNLQLC